MDVPAMFLLLLIAVSIIRSSYKLLRAHLQLLNDSTRVEAENYLGYKRATGYTHDRHMSFPLQLIGGNDIELVETTKLEQDRPIKHIHRDDCSKLARRLHNNALNFKLYQLGPGSMGPDGKQLEWHWDGSATSLYDYYVQFCTCHVTNCSAYDVQAIDQVSRNKIEMTTFGRCPINDLTAIIGRHL